MPARSSYLWLAAAVIAAIAAVSGAPSAARRAPSIIFIMADDLGYGDAGTYGQKHFATPALDRMAREGVKFLQFYSASTVCAPAREALMTGRHTGHTGRWRNEEKPLSPDTVTIAERLRRAGYRTAMIGKWALGELGTPGEPGKMGYDYWFGFLNQRHAHQHYPTFLFRNGETVTYPLNYRSNGSTYAHDELIREAVGFIRDNRSSPFFVYLPLTLPHADLSAPPAVLAAFAGRFPEHFQHGGVYVPQTFPNAAYAAMVTLLDEGVAAILDVLAETGLDDNTIVFFTSDNGPTPEAGVDLAFFNSSGGLRGGKRDLYEGGIRVPMLVRWPGSIPAGTVTRQVAYLPDIMPTLLELAGVPPARDTDGLSLLALLRNPASELPERSLYWAWQEVLPGRGDVFMEAVRRGRWKALRTNRVAPSELYDIEIDPDETTNLASEHPQLVAELERIMEREFAPPHR